MTSGLTFLMAARRYEIAGLEQLALTSVLVSAIGRFVHALQRERGLSNLYLGSRGACWRDERAQQITECERLQAAVRNCFDHLDTQPLQTANGARLFSRIAYILQGLEALPRLRERIAACALGAPQATAAFVRLVSGLLAVVFEAADSAPDPDISRRLVAMFNFMQGKELAGQERAAGAALFAGGQADADGQHRLLGLIESQERCLHVFAEFASGALQATWQRSQRPEVLAGLERLRRVLGTAPSGGPLDTGLSQAWFDACTARIDAMKDVEDALAAELLALCEQRLGAARQELVQLELLQAMPAAADGAAAEADFFASPDGSAQPLAGGQIYGPQVGRSILDLVQAQARRLQHMSDELDTARASLNERKLIERAKGLLMAHRQFSEDEAHKALRQMAMNQNRRLVEVAEAVLSAAAVLPERQR